MKKIKRINELFDTEELKSEWEIPYLQKGKDIMKSFKVVGSEVNTLTDKFLWKLLYIYPELIHFKQEKISNQVLGLFNKSETEYEDGRKYYCQLGLYSFDDEYGINIIIKDLEERNPDNFFIKEGIFEKIEDSYPMIEWFLETSKKLNCLEESVDYKFRNN